MRVVVSCELWLFICFFFSSRRRHTRSDRDWSSDVCSSDLAAARTAWERATPVGPGRLVARVVRVDLPSPRLSLHNCLRGWLPAAVTLPLDGAFPSETTLTAVALGDTAWVALPGEPATALGQRIKTEAPRAFGPAFVAGVSNGYIGSLVAAADHGPPPHGPTAS